MVTLQRLTQTSPHSPRNYWIKVYLKDPYTVKFLGPFSSPKDAQNLLNRLSSEGQTIVSCFEIMPLSHSIPPDHLMSHTQWLQELMEDYLHIKVP